MEYYDIIERTDKAEPQERQLFLDSCSIIEQAQSAAYRSVNETLIKRNWLLGMRIQHEILKERRAEYGEQVIKTLSKELTMKYGDGFSRNNLYRFISFFKSFPDIFNTAIGETGIVPSLTGQSEKVPSPMGFSDGQDIYGQLKCTQPIRLSWTHYSIILQEPNTEARAWYEREAAREMWSTRTLQRNVSSQYYHRLLKSQDKALVHDEMIAITKPLQDRLEFDLKTNKLSYQDVGQMDMYVKMYDELVRPDGHNPTIGILLCADTDEDLAHYSVLNNNDQLFAAKYLTYMPTQEELRREIEQQKEFFRLQNGG